MFTKLRIVKTALLSLFCLFTVKTSVAQVAEAALATAIGAHTVAMSKIMAETQALQVSISGENAIITGMLSSINDYEKKMYDYMSKTQGFISNLYSIGKCLTLGTQIAEEIELCFKEAKAHPENAIISSLVTDQIGDVTTEVLGLTGYIEPIVTRSGKDNLLNSAERIRIINTVQNRLHNILNKLRSMRYNIHRMNLTYFVSNISPELYHQFFNTETAYDVALDALKAAEKKL